MSGIFDALRGDASFYLVRHGESEGNREKRIQGHTDLPLTEQGIEHASLTGQWFSGHNIDWICSSPLMRARQTANEIARYCDCSPVEDCSELKELDTGTFSNRTFDEIKLNDPGLYADFHARSWEAVPGAESVATIQERARLHWHYLVMKANEGHKHLVSVSHYGFIQWLYKTSFNLDYQTWMPLLTIGNCAVFHLFVSPRMVGETRHFYAEWRLINYPAWQTIARS